MKELKPTLWRSCRVIAHDPRLRLVRLLLPDQNRSVTDLANEANLTEGVASAYLRMLGARGLLLARPRGRNVFYSAEANPNVENAAELLNALKTAFSSGASNEEIIHYSTAFTHQRRIEIINALRDRKLMSSELVARTDIPHPSMSRHLRKLESRGMIAREKELCRVAYPKSMFARTLLMVAFEETEGQ